MREHCIRQAYASDSPKEQYAMVENRSSLIELLEMSQQLHMSESL